MSGWEFWFDWYQNQYHRLNSSGDISFSVTPVYVFYWFFSLFFSRGALPPSDEKFKHDAWCTPIFLLSLNTKIMTVGWIGAELWTDFRLPHPRKAAPHPRKAANFHKICIFNELGGSPPVCRNLNMNHSVARSFLFNLIPNLSGYAQWVLRYKMFSKKCIGFFSMFLVVNT